MIINFIEYAVSAEFSQLKPFHLVTNGSISTLQHVSNYIFNKGMRGSTCAGTVLPDQGGGPDAVRSIGRCL